MRAATSPKDMSESALTTPSVMTSLICIGADHSEEPLRMLPR
jgi:hypothetical protein